MSRPERDPLAGLPRETIPEPDAARMQATIAQSTALFRSHQAQQHQRQLRSSSGGWQAMLDTARRWLVPAAIGAAATAATMTIVPMTTLQQAAPPVRDEVARPAPAPEVAPPQAKVRSAPSVAAPADLAQAPTRNSEAPPRMGARPPGMARERAAVSAPLERYNFDGLVIGVRNLSEAAEMTLIDGAQEHRFYVRIKRQDERIALFDAFHHRGAKGEDLLFVRSGMGSDQRWDAFERNDGRYTRSVAVSRLIEGARNRDDIIARLKN